jgi:hypothetical protein
MSSAQVHSLQRLTEFQTALANFRQQAGEALCSVAVEVRRVQDWLEGQLGNWEAEVRRAEDAVIKAKQELARRRLQRVGDRPADTTEQEVALARAVRRLEFAEEKRERTRQWIRKLPDEVLDYEAQANLFQGVLESEVPRMNAFLDRKLDILEAYTHGAAPEAPAAPREEKS